MTEHLLGAHPERRVPAAQKGFVHTSLALAEDDGGLVAGWCPSSRCVRAPCSHSLFYADRLACAGTLRVPGFILIAHGSNGRVVYRPGDGCSACARVGTRDETNAGPRDQTGSRCLPWAGRQGRCFLRPGRGRGGGMLRE